jgi:hypothetical protein
MGEWASRWRIRASLALVDERHAEAIEPGLRNKHVLLAGAGIIFLGLYYYGVSHAGSDVRVALVGVGAAVVGSIVGGGLTGWLSLQLRRNDSTTPASRTRRGPLVRPIKSDSEQLGWRE